MEAAAEFVAVRGDHRIAIVLGSRVARVDDAPAQLPMAPFAHAGTTYVPLAVVARALGGNVAYDGPSHTFAVTLVPRPIAAMTPTVDYTPPPDAVLHVHPEVDPAAASDGQRSPAPASNADRSQSRSRSLGNPKRTDADRT